MQIHVWHMEVYSCITRVNFCNNLLKRTKFTSYITMRQYAAKRICVATCSVTVYHTERHSWASASRPMPPSSAVRYPGSRSVTGIFRFLTGMNLLIPVPDWFRHRPSFSFRDRTDRMPKSPAFRHLKAPRYC